MAAHADIAPEGPAAPTADGDWARALLERRIAMLAELGEAALEVALTMRDQLVAAAPARAAGAAAEADPSPADGEGAAPQAADAAARPLAYHEAFPEAFAEAVPEAAPPPPPPARLADLSLAFHRAARAVRLTLALQARLCDEMQNPGGGPVPQESRVTVRFVDSDGAPLPNPAGWGGAGEGAAPAASPLQPPADPAAVAGVVRRVAEAALIPGERDPREAAESAARLEREAVQRLEREDDGEGDLLRRPFSEIVELVCRDLGLYPDWPALADEAWARAEIAGGRVGAPLAPFSSPASGGGGPAQPVEGAQGPPTPSAPSAPSARAGPAAAPPLQARAPFARGRTQRVMAGTAAAP